MQGRDDIDADEPAAAAAEPDAELVVLCGDHGGVIAAHGPQRGESDQHVAAEAADGPDGTTAPLDVADRIERAPLRSALPPPAADGDDVGRLMHGGDRRREEAVAKLAVTIEEQHHFEIGREREEALPTGVAGTSGSERDRQVELDDIGPTRARRRDAAVLRSRVDVHDAPYAFRERRETTHEAVALVSSDGYDADVTEGRAIVLPAGDLGHA
jgi:hypothetical protein